MKNSFKKVLMGLLTVFMVCVIVSTATTTVTAADGWGTLKAGDEMQWTSTKWGTVKMKVLNVEGKTITIDYEGRGDKETHTIDADASIHDPGIRDISPWLLPKSMIEDDLRLGTQNYEFEGTTYKAYYSESSRSYYDFNTGILFESKSSDGTITNQLVSTNADLSEVSGGGGGGCLGTVLIALVSITTVVSYGLVRYRKKTV